MKWQADDNTRSAIHYLVLGLVLVVALRAGWWLLQWSAMKGVPAEELPFRNGYVGLGAGVWTVARQPASMRLLGGVGLVALMAFVIGASVAVCFRAGRPRVFQRTAWAVFVPGCAWAVWAALFAPIRSASLTGDAILLREHRELLMDLPRPFSRTEWKTRQGEVQAISIRADGPARLELVLLSRYGDQVIASADVTQQGGDRPQEQLLEAARWSARRIASALHVPFEEHPPAP